MNHAYDYTISKARRLAASARVWRKIAESVGDVDRLRALRLFESERVRVHGLAIEAASILRVCRR